MPQKVLKLRFMIMIYGHFTLQFGETHVAVALDSREPDLSLELKQTNFRQHEMIDWNCNVSHAELFITLLTRTCRLCCVYFSCVTFRVLYSAQENWKLETISNSARCEYFTIILTI